ncbi:serine hydrolase domain-containing protein [uncultured Flavobacterium sp.]|uniref:serine hydrolase domain-containing protein n=1 Tax=uncultured Flavobacterium sp. TaxID=165435 RepID=UPI0025F9F95C|nr:serine hydrolase domain-containing protein [uncultured Flavobacterium sp.]
MNKFITLFSLIVLISCTKQTKEPIAQSKDTSVADALSARLESLHKKGMFAGFGVAIVTADSVLYQNGFGLSDIKGGKKYTSETVQPIASVSKTFIGIALLKAQEMGKLKLSDPVNKYLKFTVSNPAFPDTAITLKHLATHTSTLNDEGTVYMDKGYVLDNDAQPNISPGYPQAFNPASTDNGLEAFLESVLVSGNENYKDGIYDPFVPGQNYQYSNIGASLAALVLEKATGMPYDHFVSKFILEPLKMNDSGFYGRGTAFKHRSYLYTGNKEVLPMYHCITYPDGGLVTSAADMGKYLQELIKGYHGKGNLLTRESYAQFFTTCLGPKNFIDGREEDNPYSDEYNSVIFIGFSPKGYIGHTGGDPGISSLMFFDPKTGIGRFLMINTDIDDKQANDVFYEIWDTLDDMTGK